MKWYLVSWSHQADGQAIPAFGDAFFAVDRVTRDVVNGWRKVAADRVHAPFHRVVILSVVELEEATL